MTLAEFLAWEARQELRYEFDGVRPVVRNGGTAAHATIQCNLLAALVVRLRGSRCQAYGSQLKLQVAGRIRYPDAFVVSTRLSPLATVVSEPVVVFEVLGDEHAHEDLVVKNAEYCATPSIQCYVVLQQTHANATVFTRKGDDWVTELVNVQHTLNIPEIGIAVPLLEIYVSKEITGELDEIVSTVS